MSETSRNKALLSKLSSSDFKYCRLETRLQDGVPDILLVSRLTGKVSFIESKDVKLSKSGTFKIDLDPTQSIFSREFNFISGFLSTYVLCFLPDHKILLISPENSAEWCSYIRKATFSLENLPSSSMLLDLKSEYGKLVSMLHGSNSLRL